MIHKPTWTLVAHVGTVAHSHLMVSLVQAHYYGMSAQLKTVVDRFCAYNSSLNSRHLKSALLTVVFITGHDSKAGLKLVSDEPTGIFRNSRRWKIKNTIQVLSSTAKSDISYCQSMV